MKKQTNRRNDKALVLAVAILLGNFMISSNAFAFGAGTTSSFDNTCGTNDWNTGTCWKPSVFPSGEFVPGSAGFAPYTALVGDDSIIYTANIASSTPTITTVDLYTGNTINMSGGTLNLQTDVSFFNTPATVNNSGIIQGTGTITNLNPGVDTLSVYSKFNNNGKLIADGGDLNITGFKTMTTSSFPSPPASGYGYYVENAGKLTTPAIPVTGNGTYTWGSGANSVTGTFSGVSGSGSWSVSLLAPGNGGIPGSTPDSLYNYWAFSNTGFTFTDFTFTIYYNPLDPRLAAIFTAIGGESNFTAWHFNGTNWVVLNAANTANHTLSGSIPHFDGVGGGGGPASVPELPAGSAIPLLVIFGAGILWLRKRLTA